MAARAFVSVLCADPGASATWYGALLGLTPHFAADWFVILTDPAREGFEYGLLQRDHAAAPAQAVGAPQGVMMTFVVADCDAAHTTAQRMGAEILSPPQDMPYGQRRMLVRDPDGLVLDISAPTAPAP